MRLHKIVTGTGILLGIMAVSLLRQKAAYILRGKTVLVTGGSRGLGLLLAQTFASREARVAILARDADELARALQQLETITSEVVAIRADVTVRSEAEDAVQQVRQRFGSLDILVNNAGIITVGPLETATTDDYRDSIDTHFWGAFFTSMAVLPEMRRRGQGRIVNIASIGGKISVPHLLPYCVGKFALTGFSEGLRSEVMKDNIKVTTVCPGLMRTGSPRNASFKGSYKAEYVWFSLAAALPLISMNANRAARQVVDACQRGDAEVVLSLPARLLVKLHDLTPLATADLLSLANRLLPAPGTEGNEARKGKDSVSKVSPSWLTNLGDRAAEQNNEVA